jgi:6-phosphogluconolactonase/glucosamine-6-phosphate isomerase/deaminase
MDRQALIGLNHFKNKEGLLVVEAPTAQKANEIVSEILQKYCDAKTALFLSGGTTPGKLYEMLAREKTLKVGAVGLTDERYGERGHKKSNELMIRGSGLLGYFDNQNVRFYPMLNDKSITQETREYDESLRFIFKYFPKNVALAGLGSDGHTFGIPAISAFSRKMFEDQSSLVSFYEAINYGPRITMNFNAISVLDLIIVLVLGQEKREILSQMFKTDGSPEQIEKFSAKFYLKPEIASKVILITDQML